MFMSSHSSKNSPVFGICVFVYPKGTPASPHLLWQARGAGLHFGRQIFEPPHEPRGLRWWSDRWGISWGETIVDDWDGRMEMNWLVGSTPLKHISQLGWLFPIFGKKKCSKPPTSERNIGWDDYFFHKQCGHTEGSWGQQFRPGI